MARSHRRQTMGPRFWRQVRLGVDVNFDPRRDRRIEDGFRQEIPTLAVATNRLAEAVPKSFSSDPQAVGCPGVISVVGERNRPLIVSSIRVDVDAKRIPVPNHSIEQLIVPTNDEIDLTKTALDVGSRRKNQVG